jgi:hypothetical protein
LAEANESRDWRIYAELAQRLILQARKLYAKDDLGVDLDAVAYALDSTTIDLCLNLFPWAHFRSTKSAVKMHTLLDLRGNIPAFIRVTTGDVHDVNILDEILPPPGAYYVMDRGYLVLRPALSHPSGRSILCYTRQTQPRCQPHLLRASG